MFNKLGISSVVSTSLILVVAVLSVVGFQTFFQDFSSSVFTDVEQKSIQPNSIKIVNIVGNHLYLNSNTNTNLSKILISGKICETNITLVKGLNKIDISRCIVDNDISGSVEILISNTNMVKSSSIYLDSSELEIIKKNVKLNSCKEILDYGNSVGDGFYNIYNNHIQYKVYCDMTSNGGGWTSFTNQMITNEINLNITINKSTGSNGGLIYSVSKPLQGCGITSSSVQFLELPYFFNWDKITYKEDFIKPASCWKIFGDQVLNDSGINLLTNIIPFKKNIDSISNEINMGGRDGTNSFDGTTGRCDNTYFNFWHGNSGITNSSATVILRRNNSLEKSYLYTQTSCTSTLVTSWTYSDIFFK